MKTTTKTALRLHRETLRRLAGADLGRVGGGWRPGPIVVDPTLPSGCTGCGACSSDC